MAPAGNRRTTKSRRRGDGARDRRRPREIVERCPALPKEIAFPNDSRPASPKERDPRKSSKTSRRPAAAPEEDGEFVEREFSRLGKVEERVQDVDFLRDDHGREADDGSQQLEDVDQTVVVRVEQLVEDGQRLVLREFEERDGVGGPQREAAREVVLMGHQHLPDALRVPLRERS